MKFQASVNLDNALFWFILVVRQANQKVLCSAMIIWSSTHSLLVRKLLPESHQKKTLLQKITESYLSCHFLILLVFSSISPIICFSGVNCSSLSQMLCKDLWSNLFNGLDQHCSWLFLEFGRNLKTNWKKLLKLNQLFYNQFQDGQRDMDSKKYRLKVKVKIHQWCTV